MGKFHVRSTHLGLARDGKLLWCCEQAATEPRLQCCSQCAAWHGLHMAWKALQGLWAELLLPAFHTLPCSWSAFAFTNSASTCLPANVSAHSDSAGAPSARSSEGATRVGWWYSASSVPVHCKPCARTFERDGLQRSGVRVLIKVCCSAQVHSGRLELRERCLELLYTRVAQQLDLAGAEGDSRVQSSNREQAVAGEPRPGRCALLGAGSTRQDQ